MRLAARQHGAVRRAQLLAAGVTRHQIAHRLRTGFLFEAHRGVYLVGSMFSGHAHEMAALLACGDESTLSHRSAAALWELLPYPTSAPVHVTVPPERCRRPPRIQVHRERLDPRDKRKRKAMTVTSPPRTILELAAVLDDGALEQVVAVAGYRRLASENELRRQLERYPGRSGAARLRHVVDLPGGPQRARSGGERRLLRALRDEGIDGFELNARIHGYEVDVLWRDLHFGVELDGWDAHSGRVAFERDRLKIAELEASGVTIMPVTGRQVRSNLRPVIERIRQAVERRAKG